ncbi:MAG: acyltransferase family protein [Rhodospirillales bacterium]
MQDRYRHLDGLRGIAALNVMLGHTVIACDFALYSGAPADSHAGWDIAVSAWPLLLPVAGTNFSVCAFLVLSGFVLAHAFSGARLGAAALAVKRAVRLGLPILVATLFSWALLAGGLTFNHEVASLWHGTWLDSQLAHGPRLLDALREGVYGSLIGPWSFATTYDSTLWTMQIEFAGSLALIGLFRVGRWGARFGGTRPAAGLAMLAAGALCYRLYLSLMLYGAAIYLLDVRRLEKSVSASSLRWTALLAALFLGTVPFSLARGPWWDKLVAFAPAGSMNSHWPGLAGFIRMNGVASLHGAGAILLLLLVETWPALRGALSFRLPQFLGAISFPLYLLHVPLLLSVGCGVFLAAVGSGAGIGPAALLALLVYLPVAVGAAALATRLVERPAIRIAARAGELVEKI